MGELKACLMKSHLALVVLGLCTLSCSSSSTSQSKQASDSTVYSYKAASPDGIGKVYLGREIAKVMNFAGAGWLERNERQQEENTELAIRELPLDSSSVVADIGAGTGYYTFRIAPKVPQGRVYAVDVQDESVRFLKNRARELNISNVEVVMGGAKSPNLPKGAVDLALMVDVYHELEYPHEMLQAIRESLKPNGRLLLLEYRAEDPAVPIKRLHKLSVEQANKELAANGFKLVQREDFLPIQHFLVYQKVE